MSKIMLSGGFDPLHVGHLEMIDIAKDWADETLIVLNSDDWLTRKKGKPFMCWADRAKILNSLSNVTYVVNVDDSDDTVCSAIKELGPDIFGNGGDRFEDNTPELELCNSMGIIALFGLGKKIRSSSELTGVVVRKWGSYEIIDKGHGHVSKLLRFNGHTPMGWQRHKLRTEKWTCVKGTVRVCIDEVFRIRSHYLLPGDSITIDPMQWHKADADSDTIVAEVWLGHSGYLVEEDIERK